MIEGRKEYMEGGFACPLAERGGRVEREGYISPQKTHKIMTEFEKKKELEQEIKKEGEKGKKTSTKISLK